jgi:hypothetical protein
MAGGASATAATADGEVDYLPDLPDPAIKVDVTGVAVWVCVSSVIASVCGAMQQQRGGTICQTCRIPLLWYVDSIQVTFVSH